MVRWWLTAITLALYMQVGFSFSCDQSERTGCAGPAGNGGSQETDPLVLWALGSDPDAVVASTLRNVTFTCLVTGGQDPPTSLILEEVDQEGNALAILGNLLDDGEGADLSPGDRIYTGTMGLTSTAVGTRYFRARVVHAGNTVLSPVYSLSITELPIGPVPSDPEKLVEGPSTGEMLYSDEVLVAFVGGTSQTRIREIVAEIGAEIVGSIPALDVFQLRITGDGTANGVMAAIQRLEAYPEIDYAEPNYYEEQPDPTP